LDKRKKERWKHRFAKFCSSYLRQSEDYANLVASLDAIIQVTQEEGKEILLTLRQEKLNYKTNLEAEVMRLDALSEPEKPAIATMLQEAYAEDQKEYRIFVSEL
jgi:hypothetical protein